MKVGGGGCTGEGGGWSGGYMGQGMGGEGTWVRVGGGGYMGEGGGRRVHG